MNQPSGVRWAIFALLTACGPAPVALFEVECADQDCASALFRADPTGGGTAFVWSVDGIPVAEGETYEHPGNLASAERVELRATSLGGSDVRGTWVVANEAVSPDAVGDWVPVASGFEVVEENGRTIDTECGPLAIVTSIGGCFTGVAPVEVLLSVVNPVGAAPPMPIDASNYVSPATFTPGITPDLTAGGWDAARAWVGGPALSVSWDPLVSSVVSAVPRLETAVAIPAPGDAHWAIVSVPGDTPAFHRNAVQLSCDQGVWEVGSASMSDDVLDAARAVAR